MTQSASWIGRLIVRELEGFARELARLPDEAAAWKTVAGVTNSVGSLTLHVCGNLQHFIGQVIGQSGYVRDREHEFAARDLPRAELLLEIRTTITVVERVMSTLTDDDLAQEFPEVVGGVRMITGLFLTHLCAHTGFHLGQAGYLRRILTGDSQSSGPLPLKPLAI